MGVLARLRNSVGTLLIGLTYTFICVINAQFYLDEDSELIFSKVKVMSASL